jgi:hypothetical protein
MITPAFVIFSASRCGSTALYRALNLIPGTWAAYEPAFYDHREEAVSSRITELLSDHSGFKHVFDPAGYPFRDVDWASIEEMERNESLWLKLNSAILNYPGLRIVFLRRRNGFDRLLSDQIAKYTDVGGYAYRAGSPDDAEVYRDRISRLPLPAVDESLVRWYLNNFPRIQDQLRSSVTANPVIDLWYEDFLGPEVPLPDRIERFGEIVEFLRIPAPQNFLASPGISLLLSPAAKLNDAETFERIPNYKELRDKFGVPETPGWPIPQRPTAVGRESTSRPSGLVKMPEDAGIGPMKFRLRAAGGNVAGLGFPQDHPGAVRVAIETATTGAAFDIQLNFLDVSLKANDSYTLRFCARADHARTAFIGVAQAHDPWLGLGLYEEIELSTEWRGFEKDFQASADCDAGRIHIDVGASPISAEFAEVRLTSQRDDRHSGRFQTADARI